MAHEHSHTAAAPVEREDVSVMFRAVPDEIAAIRQGWAEFEAAVGSLRGRRFFGSFDAARGEYRVCAQLRGGDDAASLGLELGTLPGGRYLHSQLRGEPPGVYDEIAPTVDRMARDAHVDPSRPAIEYYRRRDVIDLYLPVT
jgi:hypothetical protein